MGKQLRIMQSPLDVAELWSAIPDRYCTGVIPRRMDCRPESFWLPGVLSNSALLLFCAGEWQEIRESIKEQVDGSYLLCPRIGVVEWSQTEVWAESQYVVGSRIYFQGADPQCTSCSSRLFTWLFRWIKTHYYLAPAKRAPIAIGRHLMSEIKSGESRATYPSGEDVIAASSLSGGKF